MLTPFPHSTPQHTTIQNGTEQNRTHLLAPKNLCLTTLHAFNAALVVKKTLRLARIAAAL